MSAQPTPASFSSPWQLERAARLNRICKRLDQRRPGRTLHRAIGYFSWYWSGRFYKCDPARPIRLCRATILRNYYTWLSSGKTRAVFALGYCSAGYKISPRHLAAFLRAALSPGVSSFRSAFARLKKLAAGESAYRYAVAAQHGQLLQNLFKARRETMSRERRLRHSIGSIEP